eukprot:ANDGO_08201.mRNA.1 hypothetical protein
MLAANHERVEFEEIKERNDALKEIVLSKSMQMMDQLEEYRKETELARKNETELQKLNESYRQMCTSLLEQMNQMRTAHEEELQSMTEIQSQLQKSVQKRDGELRALKAENKKLMLHVHEWKERASVLEQKTAEPGISLWPPQTETMHDRGNGDRPILLQTKTPAQVLESLLALDTVRDGFMSEQAPNTHSLCGTTVDLDATSRLLLSASFDESSFLEGFLRGADKSTIVADRADQTTYPAPVHSPFSAAAGVRKPPTALFHSLYTASSATGSPGVLLGKANGILNKYLSHNAKSRTSPSKGSKTNIRSHSELGLHHPPVFPQAHVRD